MNLRPLALMAISLLCAACIGLTGDPTAPPSAAAEPGASPTRGLPDFPPSTSVPVATSTPAPQTCPDTTNGWDATLELATATGIVSIALEDGVTVPLPSESIAPLEPADVVIEGTVLGGTKLRGDLVISGFEGDAALRVTAITARFVPLDASSTAPVVVALDGPSIALTLPDKNAVGRLLLQLDWATSCGAGSGGGATALTVQNSSVAAGCPVSADAVDAALADLSKLRITIGGVVEPLDVYGWSTRWTAGDGVTDFATLFPNWDRQTLITVAPGENVAVREQVDQLHLVHVRGSIYTRADVDAYFAGGASLDVQPLTVVRRDVNLKGNVNIPAPLQPGSYVFDIDATWLTSCFQLQTTRSVSVRVS